MDNRTGYQVIEDALKRVAQGNIGEAPPTLDAHEARIYLAGMASAYQHALEMIPDSEPRAATIGKPVGNLSSPQTKMGLTQPIPAWVETLITKPDSQS